MAKAPRPPGPTYQPGTLYRIRVNRVVREIPGLTLRPRDEPVLDGAACETIKDAIVSAIEA